MGSIVVRNILSLLGIYCHVCERLKNVVFFIHVWACMLSFFKDMYVLCIKTVHCLRGRGCNALYLKPQTYVKIVIVIAGQTVKTRVFKDLEKLSFLNL